MNLISSGREIKKLAWQYFFLQYKYWKIIYLESKFRTYVYVNKLGASELID
jgi:hypothetical protein